MMRKTPCASRETRASRIPFQTKPHEIPKSHIFSGIFAGLIDLLLSTRIVPRVVHAHLSGKSFVSIVMLKILVVFASVGATPCGCPAAW